MNKKTLRLLYEISQNSRITTNQLGKELKISQQSASYLLKRLKEKRLIKGFTTIFDPVKFGLTNIIVGYDLSSFDTKTKKNIIDCLKQISSVVAIQECSQGIDLLAEYSVSNLSAFNKQHTEFLFGFKQLVHARFIMPIIVKHLYPRKYLKRESSGKEIIICGDRDLAELTENQRIIAEQFLKNPESNFLDMSKSTKLSVKTIINAKKRLEENTIIRGYGAILNHKKLGIKRYLIFLKLTGEGIGSTNKLLEYSKQNKNIIELIKIIGNHHIMLAVEQLDGKNILNEIRSLFSVEEYMLVDIEDIIFQRHLPLG